MSKVMLPPESVYNNIPREEPHIEKPPRYMSKFRRAVVCEEKLSKDVMRTMGPAKVEMPSPDKYLRKHSKEPKLPEKKEYLEVANRTFTMKKPPVPLRTDNPPMGIRTKRDFTKTPVLVPKMPQPIYVDTKRGDKHLLENSGLVPKYINKKDYGEIPEYLQQRNEDAWRAQEEYDNYVKEQRRQGALKQLSDEEREAILKGLRKNWDELYHEYQCLSVVIDTLSKRTHKERLETEMKQLEADIKLFEKFKTIYISNN
ncbi:hypothetical protein LDENG_00145430 [Lucifuga dentata]|nr:hypothetical protein LDENG_00145430 [Lucifuga dentata]